MPLRGSGARLAIVGAGAAAAVHLIPAATSIRAVRLTAFPRLSGVGHGETIAVTFDDGPDPASTPHFLEKLHELGWPATFFMVGSMVRRAPRLAAEVAAAGHDVGLHGDEHRNLLFRGPLSTAADLLRGFDALGDAIGSPPKWFRPPYGVLTAEALVTARRLGLRSVLWTAWGRDWRAEATAESIVADVRRGLHPGGTVLLHDTSVSGSWRATLQALQPLDHLIRRLGTSPAPLSEHMSEAQGKGQAIDGIVGDAEDEQDSG
jgi:peptidoglycan/xylan/chitin deacetylase (PgdA/CDA1 family)